MTETSSPGTGASIEVKRRAARPKYQIFISSTFVDLKDARADVTWDLLKASYIPVGMENFSAGPERGWKTISRTIDTSDYYVLVVAGRYGSIDKSFDMSWTEREYRYAKEKGVPILAFIRDASHVTVDKAERGEPAARLENFIKELWDLHLCERWTTEADLCGRVVQAVRKLIDENEADNAPRPGWYRGDDLPSSAEVVTEMARLSSENRLLRTQLEALSHQRRDALEVWLEEERAVGQIERSQVYYVLNGRSNNNYIMSMGIEPFVELTNRVWWLRMQLRNVGAAVAQNVVVELEVVGTEDGIFHPDRLSTIPGKDWEEEIRRRRDPNAYVYVDLLEKGRSAGLRVRQRVKGVAVGGREQLIEIGLRGRFGEDEKMRFVVRFSATSQDGAHVAGEFSVAVSRDERRLHEDAIRAKHS